MQPIKYKHVLMCFIKNITSILTSPSVEMYVHQTPFNQTDVNKFIAVKLSDGSFTFNNKILISN
jgi:hypothetical protein